MSDPKESAPKESADSLSPEDLDKVAGGDGPKLTIRSQGQGQGELIDGGHTQPQGSHGFEK
jgi:hypothetical protein